MVETSRVDILVAGGGPAGMAAALVAASRGYDVRLAAPAAPAGGRDERTTALMAPAVDFLDHLGVWEHVEPEAAPLKTLRIIDASKRLFRGPTVSFDAEEIGETAFGYNIANSVLNTALTNAVDAAPSIRRAEALVSSASFGGDNAGVVLMDGEKIEASLVVAADGVNSLMREAAGIGARRWSYPQSAVVLAFDHTRPHNFVSTEFHTPSGPFTLVPMQGNRSSLVWVVKPEEADRIRLLEGEALAREIETRMESMLGKVSNVSTPQVWPLSGMIAHRLAARRVVLVGQSGHMFPPIGAQGLNLGLRDVADLGRSLSSAGSDPGALSITARYDSLRRLDVVSRTGAVDLLNRSLLTDFLPVQMARAAGLSVLGGFRPLRDFMMREGIRPGTGLRGMFRLPSLKGRDRAAEDRWS